MSDQISKKPGPFQESDGSVSMRRIIALVFALAAIALFFVGGINKSIEAVYGGVGCILAVVILLFFTTWDDISKVVEAVKGKQ